MKKDETVEVLEKLITKPARVRLRGDEPLIEGTSLHREDVNVILGERALRHRVELTRNEPAAPLEEPTQRAGKTSGPAPAGGPPAGPTSPPGAAKKACPEAPAEPRSKTRSLRRRIAELKAELAGMEKKR